MRDEEDANFLLVARRDMRIKMDLKEGKMDRNG